MKSSQFHVVALAVMILGALAPPAFARTAKASLLEHSAKASAERQQTQTKADPPAAATQPPPAAGQTAPPPPQGLSILMPPEPAAVPPAQNPAPAAPASTTPAAAKAAAVPPVVHGVPLPAGYVVGPEDVVGVLFWHDQEMSGDVSVRPDGMITLPLIGDLRAAGLEPDALKAEIEKEAAKYVTEPNVTVFLKQINSRKVFITGEVAQPGAYSLAGPRTVMQLIALAGGLREYADAGHITIMRIENGRQRSFKFDYKKVAQGKALQQNIQLQPGDTVVVP